MKKFSAMIKKGKIGVTTENIFPIIKQFLYTEQEIFLRELVSNAVDATQKVKALARKGELEGELGDLTIRVKIDKDKGTLTISDRGIGMTAEEVDKYINQIAFTSANEFLEKYKDSIENIIGRFGLGFYSAFMVAKKVELITKSYKKDAKAVKWSCEGNPEFEITEAEKDDRGTDVILYIDEDSKEYLEETKIEQLLNKYCKFLPIPIAFGKTTEYVDGKPVEKDKIINDTNPLWKRKPSELKDKDYLEFYKKLYPDIFQEPLFYIHLNVDYPFNLTGILYFPRIRTNLDIRKNKIQLYANQVFVTDSVENIVPEFLTLLHGVIDSPDIPLNVSRSALQADPNVRKISAHITKKVADKLTELFKNKREDFEQKWDDLKLFIQYGMMTEEKFYEKALKFYLLKNVDGKYFSFEEYEAKIKDKHTDKDGKLIYLYATNKQEQFAFISAAQAKGYDVLLMDGHLDVPFLNFLESKFENKSFVRVDADTIDNLIKKDEQKKEISISEQDQEDLRIAFEEVAPNDKGTFFVDFRELSKDDLPIIITQSEYMRRMKEIGKISGPEAHFYNNLPDTYNIVVNTANPLIIKLVDQKNQDLHQQLEDFDKKANEVKREKEALQTIIKDKKEEELTKEEKEKRQELEKQLNDIKNKRAEIIRKWAKENRLINEIMDLALLANNMLIGEHLMKFVNRTVKIIEENYK